MRFVGEDKGTSSAPAAIAVTVTNGKLTNVADNLIWTMEKGENSDYIFHPGSETATWLYINDTNNGVRVGTNTNKNITLTSDYLTIKISTDVTRYIGVYNKQDWRCYKTINSNIEGQSFTFYVKQ